MTISLPGSLFTHDPFPSRYAPARRVDVWCPPSYSEHAGPHDRFPVVYMHDGQNLFDPALAYGGVTWGVAEAVASLQAQGRLRAPIIVGIWNMGEARVLEYMPSRPINSSYRRARARLLLGALPDSDNYLRFVVEELKPFIDATYPTLPGREDTFIIGSSMGGLISLYAISEFPHVFGGAACLSTHWPAGGNFLVDSMGMALPAPGDHRLYFDFGTAELDAKYEPFQRRMDGWLQRAGYTETRDWITLTFPGAGHSERAWKERVERPLLFLLGRQPSP